MSAPRYVGVAMAYASEVNPEPGIRRAPTIDEQTRAISRAAVAQGGVLLEPVVVAHQNVGLGRDVLEAITGRAATGAYFLTIDVLRSGRTIDEALLCAIWELTGRVDLLIEDVHLGDAASFRNYLDMVRAINEVRVRDASPAWLALVHDGAPQ